MKTPTLLGLSAAIMILSGTAWGGSANGSASQMPALYDGKLFTINFMELPAGGEAANLARNPSINTLFQSDPGLPGGEMFITVLDAIQGDGFNPLWQEVQITFTAGHTPRQLYSDNEVAAAFMAGEITLRVTGELYRCAVVGPGPK
jgi:hypothetical protein